MKRQREEAGDSGARISDISDDEAAENKNLATSTSSTKKAKRSCPYLDTVDRQVLDFDFEKVCSVSLSPINVYACLVCGKFYQGRTRTSHAVTHSLETDHRVFMNLSNGRCYCLPDDYEIDDSALDDVKRYLEPHLTKDDIANLDKQVISYRALDNKQYLCGLVGLNNVNRHDHLNVVFQSLAHLSSFRDFWLDKNNYFTAAGKPITELVGRFGALIRRLWNPHNYRNHISPQELLLEVSRRSEKKFRVGLHGDPLDFLSWLLNTLHRDLLSGTSVAQEMQQHQQQTSGKPQQQQKRKKNDQSAVTSNFQGKLKIVSEKEVKEKVVASAESDSEEGDADKPKTPRSKRADRMDVDEKKLVTTTTETPFFFLSLDLPSVVLIKDELQRNILQQRSIFELLTKFDGKTKTFVPTTRENRTHVIVQLPKYLIIHFRRFTKNQWFAEKNKTIVNFPLKYLDLKDYVQLPPGVTSQRYNLVTNIRHDGGLEDGTYSLHVFHKSINKWYNVQDLTIDETEAEPIAISEAYIQVYERSDV